MKCVVTVEVPDNPKIDDLVAIECHVSGVPPATTAEDVRAVIARRVYNSNTLDKRLGNRLQKHADDEIPSFFSLRDKCVARLVDTSIIVLLGGLVAGFVFPGVPEKVLLPAIAYQFAICIALLSYFLLFITRQFSHDAKDAIGARRPHPLFLVAELNVLFFWLSLLLLCAASVLRLMAWTTN